MQTSGLVLEAGGVRAVVDVDQGAASAPSSSTAGSCWSARTRTARSTGAATPWRRGRAGSGAGAFAFARPRAPAAAHDAAARDPRRRLRPAVARHGPGQRSPSTSTTGGRSAGTSRSGSRSTPTASRSPMTLEADEPHARRPRLAPWFRRVLAPGDAAGRLAFEPGAMLLRDADGMPSAASGSPRRRAPGTTPSRTSRRARCWSGPAACGSSSRRAAPGGSSTPSPRTRSASSPSPARPTPPTAAPRSSSRARP